MERNINNMELPFEYYLLPDDMPQCKEEGLLLSHIETCGIYMCEEGEIEIIKDGMHYIIRKHDILYFFPTTILKIVRTSDDSRGILVHMSLEYIYNLGNRILDSNSQLYVYSHPLFSLNEEQHEYLHKLIMILYKKMEAENTGVKTDSNLKSIRTELIKSMFYNILLEIIHISLENKDIIPSQFLDKKTSIMQKFFASLYYNNTKERDVSFYADEQNLSPSYFSAIIKEKTGFTAQQCIIKSVTSYAKQMLEYTDMSIKEISAQMNFPTQTFFGKYFKRYTGVSPKRYRSDFNR